MGEAGRVDSRSVASLRTTGPTGSDSAVNNFVRMSPSGRTAYVRALGSRQARDLAAALIARINDPQRSEIDPETGMGLPSMMEHSPNHAKITLAIAGLKTIIDVNPRLAFEEIKKGLASRTHTDQVKRDYVELLEYMANRRPQMKQLVVRYLEDFIKGKSLYPYSSQDFANRILCRLKGIEEPPAD